MRFIKEIDNQFCKAQLYSFNNKFVLKFEIDSMAQIYKFSEQEVMSHEEIEENLDEVFYQKIMKRFEDMAQDYGDLLESIDGL
jgi:hypothetical protein